jgi:hypothetical protein
MKGGGSSNLSREFNLSIEKNLNEVNSSLNNPTFSFGNLDETLTIGIGTALYRAPEQESAPIDSSSSTSLPYTQKADMYSLGIILFEMCHPKFSTGMERLIIIKKLREKQEFPSNFQASISKELFKIIKWLIQYDPKERPSANELLLSDLMPSKVSVSFVFLGPFLDFICCLCFSVFFLSWLLLSISCCFAGFLVSVLSSASQVHIDSSYLGDLQEALEKPHSTLTKYVLTILFNKMKHLKEYESSSQFLNEILYNNLSYYITSFQKDQRFLHYRLLKEHTSSSSASAVASSSASSSLPASITNQTASSTLASSVIASSTSGTMIVNSLFYLNSLKKFLISLFELHGAVEYSNQFLELKTSTSEYTYYSSQYHSGMTGGGGSGGGGGGTSQPSSSSSSASLSSLPSSISSPYCEYIDNNGQVILLPSNLITSFARFAAFSNLSFSQRYSIEKIYLKNSKRGTHSSSSNKQHQLSLSALSCQQPDVIHEAIYDMIVPANGTIQSILIEFEILSVALSFLSSFSSLLPNFLLRLGHPFLTEGIVGVCCIDYTKETSLGNTLEDCQFKIKKILSIFHEILDEKELSDYIKEQSLPVNQANKIFIFCRNLLLQRNSSSSSASSASSASNGVCSPLLELQQIEKVS